MNASGAAGRSAPTVVLSLDLELAWGSFYRAWGPALVDMARWTHDHGAPLLLEQLTRNGLSATWAVVGAVMLDRLPDDVRDLAPHRLPDGRDWFALVPPGATEATAPEWFGASLVRRLLQARPTQDVGFHGFSHVVLGDARVSRERARQELERCAALGAALGIHAPSFVFPRNGIGHLDLLRAAGMGSFRGAGVHAIPVTTPPLSSAFELLADLLGLRPALVRPSLDQGLVNVPSSLMVRHAAGWRRLIPDAQRSARLRKGLAAVRRHGGVFHVWLHPENLYFQRPRLERLLADFHAELGDLAAAGAVRVATMRDLVGDLLRVPSGTPQPPRREWTSRA
jgi:peptidoglycan/xylan/chitin deacetylase (PgdA/CDA1 family)